MTEPTLAEFLLARIEEDERFAKRLCWPATDDGHNAPISRERLLTECEAKRQIVELHVMLLDILPTYGGWWDDSTLCLLALPYAGHLDYRDEWRLQSLTERGGVA